MVSGGRTGRPDRVLVEHAGRTGRARVSTSGGRRVAQRRRWCVRRGRPSPRRPRSSRKFLPLCSRRRLGVTCCGLTVFMLYLQCSLTVTAAITDGERRWVVVVASRGIFLTRKLIPYKGVTDPRTRRQTRRAPVRVRTARQTAGCWQGGNPRCTGSWDLCRSVCRGLRRHGEGSSGDRPVIPTAANHGARYLIVDFILIS